MVQSYFQNDLQHSLVLVGLLLPELTVPNLQVNSPVNQIADAAHFEQLARFRQISAVFLPWPAVSLLPCHYGRNCLQKANQKGRTLVRSTCCGWGSFRSTLMHINANLRLTYSKCVLAVLCGINITVSGADSDVATSGIDLAMGDVDLAVGDAESKSLSAMSISRRTMLISQWAEPISLWTMQNRNRYQRCLSRDGRRRSRNGRRRSHDGRRRSRDGRCATKSDPLGHGREVFWVCRRV